MTQGPPLAPSTAAGLRTLRLRMTALIALVATVAVTVLSIVILRENETLGAEQQSADLLAATRALATEIRTDERYVELAAGTPLSEDGAVFAPADVEVLVADESEDAEDGDRVVDDLRLVLAPDDPVAADVEDLAGIAAEVVATDEEQERTLTVDRRTVQVLATPVFDEAGVVAVTVGVADVTELQADRAALRRQVLGFSAAMVIGSAAAAWFVAGRAVRPVAAALAQQERFIADAAHELRTPVAAMRTAAEAALRADGDDETAATLARLSARTATLTDDLLALARMDAERVDLDRSPLRLDLLVDAAVDGMEAVRITTTPTIVDGDDGLLERAILNLAHNAVDHGEATAEAPAEIRVGADGVTVADRGPGVADAQQARIFERFSSRPGSTGHGLGLPLTRWIARAHGGEVTHHARQGGGSVFTLRLPGRPVP